MKHNFYTVFTCDKCEGRTKREGDYNNPPVGWVEVVVTRFLTSPSAYEEGSEVNVKTVRVSYGLCIGCSLYIEKLLAPKHTEVK